ncbi:MAG: helix-turn-helix domain-containing protein [Calothrix sp. FI2-JRJ7]|nr:helix-turn-helix domain-containing protein [Calothrix sp. FI2-JRJ7]
MISTIHIEVNLVYNGQMLGVRRASVSVTAAVLQKAGIIQYSRGKMRIIDSPQMENIACECYKIIKNDFDRLLGNNRKI